MRNIVVKPDTEQVSTSAVKVFLAGTIDNGHSIDWQNAVIEMFEQIDCGETICFFSPRRDKWNENAGKEELGYQIRWELDHLDKSDVIVMNILGGSKSPISLLELGLNANGNKLMVFCPPSYYRYDNVKITCEKYGVKLYSTNDILVIRKALIDKITKRNNIFENEI